MLRGGGSGRPQARLGGGVDTVADFTPGDGVNHDVIVISAGSGLSNLSDILAKTSQSGVYTVINLSPTDQVYLYMCGRSS